MCQSGHTRPGLEGIRWGNRLTADWDMEGLWIHWIIAGLASSSSYLFRVEFLSKLFMWISIYDKTASFLYRFRVEFLSKLFMWISIYGKSYNKHTRLNGWIGDSFNHTWTLYYMGLTLKLNRNLGLKSARNRTTERNCAVARNTGDVIWLFSRLFLTLWNQNL